MKLMVIMTIDFKTYLLLNNKYHADYVWSLCMTHFFEIYVLIIWNENLLFKIEKITATTLVLSNAKCKKNWLKVETKCFFVKKYFNS